MRFRFALALSLLSASAALADRRREQRQSRFLNRVEKPTNAHCNGMEYSTNWAGALFDMNDNTFTFVTGKFTVPVPSSPSGSSASASAWVGIDGDSCFGGGLLQTGVDFNVNSQQEVSYDAWYEWYPDWAYYFDDLSISAGDVIRVNVTSFSMTSGLATVENLSNGLQRAKYLNSTSALCGQNAEWIVEDFEDAKGNQVPFANFGTVIFTDATAFGPSGTYTPEEATIVDIEQNSQALTSVVTDGSSVTIDYVNYV